MIRVILWIIFCILYGVLLFAIPFVAMAIGKLGNSSFIGVIAFFALCYLMRYYHSGFFHLLYKLENFFEINDTSTPENNAGDGVLPKETESQIKE